MLPQIRRPQAEMRFAALLTLALLPACVSYHSKPLANAAVHSAFETPPTNVLRMEAARIHHPLLRKVKLDLSDGIGPDQAAILAVLLNPSLRAERNRRGLAQAQVIVAGVLPNPQLSYTSDIVTGGNTAGTMNAFGLGATWDTNGLLTRGSKQAAARANLRSVDLDIAWKEWQTAQSARTTLYSVIALEAQLERAREADRALQEIVDTLQKAVGLHEKTVLDLAVAQATGQDAHATALGLEHELDKKRLALKKEIGLPHDAPLRIRHMSLPTHLTVPTQREFDGIEERRLDLLALKQGYESQEATVRAAILSQFPKLGIGFHGANDTSNVHTAGFGITLDLPVFDRNQGVIATERATRQKLFDEYTNRLFEARAEIAAALTDIRAFNREIAAAESAISALEHLVEISKKAVDEGNAEVLGYYTARSNLLQKRIQILKLEEQLVQAQTALEIASGRYLPATKP